MDEDYWCRENMRPDAQYGGLSGRKFPRLVGQFVAIAVYLVL